MQILDRTLADLTAQARALAAGPRRILGITGPPGAGKSTLAAALAAALGPDLAVVVPMDGFHLANRMLQALGARNRKGAPETFDDAGYAALLGRLRAADEPVVYAPEFRRELEEPVGSALPVRRDVPLVITEGNYLLLPDGAWPQARDRLDAVWYLALEDTERTSRLAARHELFGKAPAAARAWALGSDQANADLVAAHAAKADAVIRLRA
ncbi:nucleoside/nucleotide kinase family protein [Arthrobacter gandavensis]|nr:nucleoside/nucleotide kinase family protein [Arthrobacter gandavensis]